MFVQTWNKYLPVIKILLKRSVNTEQVLNMNKSDFQRAAGGKKVKFVFSISMTKGRLEMKENPSPLVSSFVTALQQDETSNEFLRSHDLQFAMNTDFQLVIKTLGSLQPIPVAEPHVASDDANAPGSTEPT